MLGVTDTHAARAVVGSTNFTRVAANVKIIGTVTNARLITGTVSVGATGCDLKPAKYRTKFSEALPH